VPDWGPNRVGYPIPMPQALIQMTLFLDALTFMYVSARAVGDGEYRYKFLDPLVEDLKLTLLARNRSVARLSFVRHRFIGSPSVSLWLTCRRAKPTSRTDVRR